MSKFKKIFIIIASVIAGLTASFLITVCSVKSNVGIAVAEPYSIIVFDHATTGKNIKEFVDINEFNRNMKGLTDVSVFDKLVHNASIDNKIYLDSKGKYSKWSTDLHNKNIVIEFIYNKMQDLVVYEGNDSRTISYYCISFVIPETKNFTEIAVYYSQTSNTDNNEKDDNYRLNTPLILYGNAKQFIKYIKEQ